MTATPLSATSAHLCGGDPPSDRTIGKVDSDWKVLQRRMAAGEQEDRRHTALGDTREHPVPCQECGTPTWNVDAVCDACDRRRSEDDAS